MIYVHIHAHQWWPTAQTIHESRVYRCRVCGDRAYGLHPTQVQANGGGDRG